MSLLLAFCLVTLSSFALTADGRGVFRVAVAVYDSKAFKPIQGVTLSMKDAGADELKQRSDMKDLIPMLEPKKTGEYGDAFVYYYGGFTSETGGKYRRQIRGTLVIEKEGFESMEVDLKKYFGPSFDSDTAIPLIELYLKQKSK